MIVTDLRAFDYTQNAEAIKLLTYLNERRYKKDLFENSKNLRLGIDTDFTSVFLIDDEGNRFNVNGLTGNIEKLPEWYYLGA